MKRSIAVTIAGQSYTIKSDAEESYVQSLAALVDDKMREVQRSARWVSPHAVAVLAALQIADELRREQSGRAELRRKIREKSRTLLQYLEREAKV